MHPGFQKIYISVYNPNPKKDLLRNNSKCFIGINLNSKRNIADVLPEDGLIGDGSQVKNSIVKTSILVYDC